MKRPQAPRTIMSAFDGRGGLLQIRGRAIKLLPKFVGVEERPPYTDNIIENNEAIIKWPGAIFQP